MGKQHVVGGPGRQLTTTTTTTKRRPRRAKQPKQPEQTRRRTQPATTYEPVSRRSLLLFMQEDAVLLQTLLRVIEAQRQRTENECLMNMIMRATL